MALISFTPLADGVTAVNAAATNTPLSTIYNDYNGNITDANISASAAIAFSKISGGTSTSLVAFQTFVPSPTGFTGAVTVATARYVQIGKIVFMDIDFQGTSNATTCTFTLPVAAKNNDLILQSRIVDNTVTQTTNGLLVLGAASTTATMGKTAAGTGNFTAGGTKAVQMYSVWYEAN